MKIGLIDVDGHNFPNFALLKLAGYHRDCGDEVEWAMPMFGQYDRIYASKVFTFTEDINRLEYNTDEWVVGGTGYDIKSRLAPEVESCRLMDFTEFEPRKGFKCSKYFE